MSVKKLYTTQERLENFLGVSIASGKTDDLINGAIDIVDQITGRNFVADTEATARYYNGNGKNEMRIDDCIEITKILRGLDSYFDNSEEIEAGGTSGYFLLPEYSPSQFPIQKIHLRGSWFITGIRNNEITAKWGFSKVCPDDVILATTIIAGGLWGANNLSGSGEIKSEKIGNYNVSYDVGSGSGGWNSYNRAKEILGTYKRVNL